MPINFYITLLFMLSLTVPYQHWEKLTNIIKVISKGKYKSSWFFNSYFIYPFKAVSKFFQNGLLTDVLIF